ncbi:MAG: hypothetical protein WEB13_10150 [Dehalococcoidia bacterium]
MRAWIDDRDLPAHHLAGEGELRSADLDVDRGRILLEEDRESEAVTALGHVAPFGPLAMTALLAAPVWVGLGPSATER